MALTKSDRDRLSSSDFAFPRTRQCPIHDADHVKMAWDMISNTKGVTEPEKAAARKRVLAKAKELGVDTKNWKIQAMSWDVSVQAMSLDVPETPDHPNKAPFSGVLVRLDQPSDAAPHGSFGMRTILTRAAAEAALSSLLGMAVNCSINLKGHDPRAKIGIIDSATIETDASGDFISIGGFLYASDFKDVTASIRAKKDELGFSFEAERLYISDSELSDALQIDKLTFTGAAILYKRNAAYESTSIAASRDANKEFSMDEFEKIMAELAKIGDRLNKVEAGQTARLEAASVADKVVKHAEKLKAAADDMEAAGIGCHATRGHAQILRHMADSMMAEAHSGKMPDHYSPPSMYSSREEPRADAETKKEIEGIKSAVADLGTMIKDLKASRASEGAPARKTITPEITRLMARANIAAPEGEGKLSVASVDEALKKANLTIEQRLQVKTGLRNAGVLDVAA